MNFPDELKIIENKLSCLKYEPDWFGLVRIAGWAVLFVALTNLIPVPPVDVPYKKLLEETQVTQLNTTGSDPRWVRSDFDTFPRVDDYKNIAWLTSSSVLLLKATEQEGGDIWSSVDFVPDKVNQILNSKYDVKTKEFLYLIPASRILDTYTMAMDAVVREPDAIVLALDPFWIYNNKAIFYRDPVFNHGARLWWNADDWPMQFVLASPGNHLWNILGQHISLVSLRNDYQVFLIDQLKRLMGKDLKDLSKKTVATAEKSDKPPVKLLQSLRFWLLFRSYDGDLSRMYRDGEINVTGMQAAAISQTDTGAEAWADTLVKRMLMRLKDSGIPTLVYIAPVSPNMTKPQRALDGYASVLRAFRSYKAMHETESFQILVDFPDEVTSSINFQDYIHLDKGGVFPEYLSGRVSELVNKK